MRLQKFYARTAFFTQYYAKKTLYLIKKRKPSFKRVHVNAFPAVHLKHLDWWDFGVKFSSEILVLMVALLVGGLNIYFFSGDSRGYKDQSAAAAFLNLHPNLNQLLANKNSAIYTTVADNGFIARAQADDFAGLDTATQMPASSDQAPALSDEGLVKPNPDSIQSLVEKQVKVYQTQAGDTLRSIAAANKISASTIIWANNLPSEQIKPGWSLLIPPVDGVVVTADSNTTLPDLAAKYNPEKYNKDKKIAEAAAAKLLDTIISYNGLASAEDIDDGQVVIIPGGQVLTPPAEPKPAPVKTTKPKTSQAQIQDEDNAPYQGGDNNGHLFPWGYCTWYVASRVHIPWGGNAKNWLANAKAYGAMVTKEAAVGAIVVTNDSRRYGHVALVEQVTDDQILVSEMNYKKFGKVNQRWISKNSSSIKGYIYP